MKKTFIACLVVACATAWAYSASAAPAAAPAKAAETTAPTGAAPAATSAATPAATPAAATPAAAPAPHKVLRESVRENSEGYKLMKDRKWAEAAGHFMKASQIDPLNKIAWNNLGYAQLKLYETGLSGTAAVDSAVAAFQEVAKIDPAYHPDNLQVAQGYAKQEAEWAAASAKRAGAPARTPAATGEYMSYKTAGNAAEQEGDFAFAQANYAKAESIADSPKRKSVAANWQGLMALNAVRDPQAAVDHLRRATQLDAANKLAWNNLGAALRRLYERGTGGKELIEEAVAAFKKMNEVDPAYKPENLAEAEALLTELGGPSKPAEGAGTAAAPATAAPAAAAAAPAAAPSAAPAADPAKPAK